MSSISIPALLPNGEQVFLDNNGEPLARGLVYFYVPGTTTKKDTWQDINLTVPNDNPVVLNGSGRAVIWGAGDYRQVVTDVDGNLIWDRETSSINFDLANFQVAYDLPVYMNGLAGDAEIYPIFNCVRAVTLPQDLVGSVFTCGINPSSTAVITINKNGASIGTISFSTGGVPTVSFTADVSFVAGDQLSLVWPDTQDATFSQVALTFVFLFG